MSLKPCLSPNALFKTDSSSIQALFAMKPYDLMFINSIIKIYSLETIFLIVFPLKKPCLNHTLISESCLYITYDICVVTSGM